MVAACIPAPHRYKSAGEIQKDHHCFWEFFAPWNHSGLGGWSPYGIQVDALSPASTFLLVHPEWPSFSEYYGLGFWVRCFPHFCSSPTCPPRNAAKFLPGVSWERDGLFMGAWLRADMCFPPCTGGVLDRFIPLKHPSQNSNGNLPSLNRLLVETQWKKFFSLY